MNGGLQCYVTAFWLSPFPTIRKRRPPQPSLNISIIRHNFHDFQFYHNFHRIIFISIIQMCAFVTPFPFPKSIMGATAAVICTSLCISITINDGAHCPRHILQFHLFQASLAVSSIISIPTTRH